VGDEVATLPQVHARCYNFLLSQHSRTHISHAFRTRRALCQFDSFCLQLDDVIDDVFALITLHDVFFCCNSATFEAIKHLILSWPG